MNFHFLRRLFLASRKWFPHSVCTSVFQTPLHNFMSHFCQIKHTFFSTFSNSNETMGMCVHVINVNKDKLEHTCVPMNLGIHGNTNHLLAHVFGCFWEIWRRNPLNFIILIFIILFNTFLVFNILFYNFLSPKIIFGQNFFFDKFFLTKFFIFSKNNFNKNYNFSERSVFCSKLYLLKKFWKKCSWNAKQCNKSFKSHQK